MKVDAIDHLHLMVPSLEKAKSLFSALIGGDFIGPYGGEAWNVNAVYYNVGGMEIFEPLDTGKPILGGHSSERRGIFGIAFRVKDLDASIPAAEALGLHVFSRFGSEDSGFGKFIVQAQFDPAGSFGTLLELAQRQRPDDPLYSPFGRVFDHIEFCVHDLARAVSLFAALTGHSFPPAQADEARQAISTTNALGLKLTQPVSPSSPVAQQLAAHGEGVGTLTLITTDLESGIAQAQAAGLRLIEKSQREAVFERTDVLGLAAKLIER